MLTCNVAIAYITLRGIVLDSAGDIGPLADYRGAWFIASLKLGASPDGDELRKIRQIRQTRQIRQIL